jgi:hypothetical protein
MLLQNIASVEKSGYDLFDEHFLDFINHAEKRQYEKERLIEQQKIRMNSKEYCIPSDL